jgi:uncharacterized protein (TIGR01777 family)
MRIVLPGGSGQVGQILARHFFAQGHEVTVLSRTPRPAPWTVLPWNGRTLNTVWTEALEDADAVIHLSGRSVNCRYTDENRKEILDSRVLSTRVLGDAIERARYPPKVWMNASTSTIYKESRKKPQDEFTGEIGGKKARGGRFNFSERVGLSWEKAFAESTTPETRKITLRTSMVMSPDLGGVFSVMSGLVLRGLGGTQGTGGQFVSWIHDHDFIRAIYFLLMDREITGPVNLTSPQPLPNHVFMRNLRQAWGIRFGMPSPRPLLDIGAMLMKTEPELVLKSRRVVPGVLTKRGFPFSQPAWNKAAHDLVTRYRQPI